ncbi:MAG: phage tail protein [Pseudomonadota bacterium]
MIELPGFVPHHTVPGYPGVPVGSVTAFAGVIDSNGCLLGATGVPGPPIESWGWMVCDGRQLAAGEYAELFSVLGYWYGGADDKFKLPDYRGYFLRGTDAGSGNDPDSSQRIEAPHGTAEGVGSTQQDALQVHYHSYSKPGTPTTCGGTKETAVPNVGNGCSGGPADSDCPDQSEAVRTSEYESRPKNIYVNYIIKFTYGP